MPSCVAALTQLAHSLSACIARPRAAGGDDAMGFGDKEGSTSTQIDATVDSNRHSQPSSLRWVGTEFVYFVDIPSLSQAERSLSYLHALSDTMVFELLKDFTESQLEVGPLRSHPPSGGILISGESLSKLIIPWARRVLADTSRSPTFGTSFKRRLATFASAVDETLLLHGGSILTPGPIRERFRAVCTMVLALARCASAWGDTRSVEILDNTQMLQEIITLYRAELERSWSADIGFEIERILGAGIPFVAYATASEPTLNLTKVVDPADYTPVHVNSTCTCTFVGPPVADVMALLAQRTYPVLVLEADDTLVVRDSSATPYVALSHVWADGLGSTTEAGLPLCQVRRLAALARSILPSGAFWMDALCVPEEKAARKSSIALMAKTYERAEKVLVIDGGVRAQCSLSSPKEDVLLRIATSGWMQRVWTLQEGMLAREVYFELSDGLIDCTYFDGAPYRIAQEVIPLLQHRPRDDTAMRYQSVSLRPPRCSFNEIIPLLRHRTTSKPEDEPVAIAGLLGVDAGELAAISSAQGRMRLLLLRCGSLPRCIAVYGWHSPKLDVPNFTWAPVSVSSVFWYGDPLDPLWSTCTEDGLSGRYTLIRFPPIDFGRIYGLVATVTTNRENPFYESSRALIDAAPSLGARTQPVTSGVRIDISPLFVDLRRSRGTSLVVNAVLMTRPGIPPTEREEPVAAVYVAPPESAGSPTRNEDPLRCEFIAAGRVRVDPPTVFPASERRGWVSCEATMDCLIPVLLA